MRSRFLLLPLVLVAAAALTACSMGSTTAPAAGSSASANGSCTYTEGGTAAKAAKLPDAKPTHKGEVPATISTNLGDIKVTLNADAAPCTVNSFTSLASQGYFDNTTCHRLVPEGIFVLQCGDPSATGSGGPGYKFADELKGNETYPAGTLAMANAGPNTNGSQFFIVYDDAQGLGPDYTVFGKVDQAGIDLVKKVAAKGVAANGVAPAEAVNITKVSVDAM